MSKAWMPLYIGDYLGDTSHLTQGQHGAYLLLLMHYWQKGSVPALHESCYCIASALDELSRSNVDAVLGEFFVLQDGLYRNQRLDRELAKAAKSYEKRASAANKRWSKNEPENLPSNAHALHVQGASDCDSSSDSAVEVESLEEKVREIAKHHPKIADANFPGPAVEHAICEAVARHGFEAVLEGTKRMGAEFKRRPKEDFNFIPSQQGFYRDSEYLHGSEKWQRSSNGKQAAVNATPGTGNTARDKQLRSIASLRHASAQHAPRGDARDAGEL